MNNLGEQINQVLNNLASKFGVTVDKLYPILRKQAQVELVKSIAIFIICLVSLFIAFKIIKKANKKCKEDEEYSCSDKAFFTFLISIVVIIAGFLVGYNQAMDIIQISINPDYYIAKMVMEMIKNIK
ncbi:hypothetical protein FCV38_02635 [Clostridium sporogenes]|nr:hypothetical protein [Clostridium sporogenes]